MCILFWFCCYLILGVKDLFNGKFKIVLFLFFYCIDFILEFFENIFVNFFFRGKFKSWSYYKYIRF